MIDTHCHLEAFDDPRAIALEADQRRVLTVAVTSTPARYAVLRGALSANPFIRVALGLHPLYAKDRSSHASSFRTLCGATTFIGEVGLDFSPEGRPTRAAQEATFSEILMSLTGSKKFISVHSRGAEARVLEMLREAQTGPVVLHWFSGSLGQLEAAIDAGHRFSINPNMLRSPRGRALIAAMPRDRVMTETDAPYTKVGGRPTTPWDVATAVRDLAKTWECSPDEAQVQITRNFMEMLPRAAASAPALGSG